MNIDLFGLETSQLTFQGVGSGGSSQGHTATIINNTVYSWGPGGMTKESRDAYYARNAFRDGIERKLNLSSSPEGGT